MGARPTKIVVSGPDPRGLWHWRHHDGTEGYHEVPAGLADPDWKSGTVVTARVAHHHGGPIIVAIGNSSVDQPGDAPTLLVNGEPFEVSAERYLEPGVVVTAVVRYRQNAGAQDGESEAKRRPAVVVDVGGQMSHAVIVSRELGLPCVVAATGATTAILDGTLIEVDGAAGTIRILGDG